MPIQKKLMRMFFLISGVVLLVPCTSLFVYEFYAFRQTTLEKLSTIGKIIAANSTAAIAFNNQEDAQEILAALKTEPHIVAAALYDRGGILFSQYHPGGNINALPLKPGHQGFDFLYSHLEGFQPVMVDSRQVGTLYLKYDLEAMYERFRLYGIIVVLVIFLSFLLAYLLSKILQKSISKPILDLAQIAKVISEQKDYSVRAVKTSNDEMGSLTDAFNNMLVKTQDQNMALIEFNQNLEQKIFDRTIELQSVNQELETFSYSVSHDLRAPLRAIVGFVSILEEDYSDRLDKEAKRITSVIRKNTIKMGRLIDDLLAFSRLGRHDIRKASIATTAMAKEVIQEMQVDNKNVKINWVVHEMPDIQGDISTMRQVWVNLISNAVKYSAKKEKPQIEIGFNKRERDTAFFVKDNGVGFDEEHNNKLFKVFQRLHSYDEFEGTGVGLAIIEKIISKHGGKVWAEAKVDNGACFYFSLPDEN